MPKCVECRGHIDKNAFSIPTNGRCVICHFNTIKAKKNKTTNPAYNAINFKGPKAGPQPSTVKNKYTAQDISEATKAVYELLKKETLKFTQAMIPWLSLSTHDEVTNGGGYAVPKEYVPGKYEKMGAIGIGIGNINGIKKLELPNHPLPPEFTTEAEITPKLIGPKGTFVVNQEPKKEPDFFYLDFPEYKGEFKYTPPKPIECVSCSIVIDPNIAKQTVDHCLACAMGLILKRPKVLISQGEEECFVLGCRNSAKFLKVEHYAYDGVKCKRHIRYCFEHVRIGQASNSILAKTIPGPFEAVEAGHGANPTEFLRKVEHD